MKCGLSRTAARRRGGTGIKAVLDDVMVNGGELDGRELSDLLVNHVKFMRVVGGHDLALDPGELAQNPAVKTGQLGVGHGVFAGIKIIKIGELIAKGVA